MYFGLCLLPLILPLGRVWPCLLYIHTRIRSQNHRHAEVGRDLLRTCSPTAVLKECQLEQVDQRCVLLGFEYLQGWRLCSLSELCLPAFDHLHSKSFLMFRWNFLCSSLCPWPFVLSLDTTEKSLSSSSLHCTRCLYT